MIYIQFQDMANYTCVAENIAGRKSSDPALLTVFGRCHLNLYLFIYLYTLLWYFLTFLYILIY